jgi:hypothetical protein
MSRERASLLVREINDRIDLRISVQPNGSADESGASNEDHPDSMGESQ